MPCKLFDVCLLLWFNPKQTTHIISSLVTPQCEQLKHFDLKISYDDVEAHRGLQYKLMSLNKMIRLKLVVNGY